MTDDPLLLDDEDEDKESPRKRKRRKFITVVLLCIPVLIGAWAIVASLTNLQSSRFVTAWNECADALHGTGDILFAAIDEATVRRIDQLPEREGPYPGLSEAFAVLESRCFDQKSLPDLEQDRAQFHAVRTGAVDAWRHAKSPAVDAAPGLSGEEHLLHTANDFLGKVLVPRLEGMEQPSILESIGIKR